MLRSAALALLLSVLVVDVRATRGDEPSAPAPAPSPRKAWEDLEAELRDPAKRQPGLREQRVASFLRAWGESKRQATGEDRLYVAKFLDAADRPVESAALYCEAADDAGLPDAQRDAARVGLAAAVAAQAQEDLLQDEALAKAVDALEAMLLAMEGDGRRDARADMHASLGQAALVLGRIDGALDHFVGGAREKPATAYAMASQAVRGLMGSAHRLEDYDAARERARRTLGALAEVQAGVVRAAKAAKDERALKAAEAILQRIGDADRPLQLLGRPAPEWALEHAFGKGRSLADYAGKVVVLDFWATWCPWCIKSFPAIRDLLRDYAGKDLVVVGVTTTAASVFESRYDLDEDMAEKAAAAKAKGGEAKAPLQRPRPTRGEGSQDPSRFAADGLAKAEEAKTKLLDATARVKEILAEMQEGARDPEEARKRLEAARKALVEASARLEEALIDLRRAAPPTVPPEAIQEFLAKERETIAAFIANHEMTWDVVMIGEKEPAPKYGLAGWPHALVLDRAGVVRYVKSGALLRDQPTAVARFRKVLDDLLAE
jgi:thiol-disulfide isomerase/thioredoxin